ncbi:MAG: TolC family protein [Verrucomicrobia bacterium]|nr:TolC family protein [Cytophagales bacterium]
MKKSLIIPLKILLLFLVSPAVFSQPSVILDTYIKAGFDNNLALKQQQFTLEKNILALQDAKNLYLPSVEFNASYTLAYGGRRLQFPVGDLLNPVYQTLNQMTGEDRFPQIENVNEQLAPNNFQETKIRVIHPLLNWEVKYSREIRREQITLQQAEVNLYKRQLVADIKTAYFNYLKAGKAIEIYKNAIHVLEENVRVNEKLVQNQVATQEVILRSKAELSETDFQLKQAENNRKMAQNYFNFLLNRPLETDIETDINLTLTAANLPTIENTLQREEFSKINTALLLTETQLKLGKSYRYPTINHVLDVGYQGFGYNFDSGQQYGLYNIALRWNIFGGFRNQIKLKQIGLDKSTLETQKNQLDEQVKLQVQNAKYAFFNMQESLESAKDALKNSTLYFKIISKKYNEGQSPLIEYLDARNKLTTAQLRQAITEYDLLIKVTEVERVTAGYQLY